ncbi:MAG: 50S ribosomal protein L13 [Hyphomonadaceae bacterium]
MHSPQTKSAQPADVQHKWIVIDAEGAVVGRLASFIAMRLRGKHRADFTPHVDCGDHVVVVNAEKVAFTGDKMNSKIYRRHTGYPGGIKERVAGKVLASKRASLVLEKAVERMLPKESPLARKQLGKLRVYAGGEHPHVAQSPQPVDFKSFNRKNSRIG